MPAGRPSEYNFEMCKEICEKVANGGHVIKVLDSDDRYPSWSNFRRWKNDHPELQTLYVEAIRDKSEACTLEINSIMEDVKNGTIDPQAGRLLIDTLKWFAAKFYPKMYGERTNIDHTTNGEKINQGIDISKLDTATIEAILKATNDGPVEG